MKIEALVLFMDNNENNLLQQFDKWYIENRQRIIDKKCSVNIDWHVNTEMYYKFNIHHNTETVTIDWTETENTDG